LAKFRPKIKHWLGSTFHETTCPPFTLSNFQGGFIEQGKGLEHPNYFILF
jgi:hypothetical protein